MSIGLGNHVNLPLENTKMEIESEIENTLNFLVLLFVWGWSCCHPQPTPPQKKKKNTKKKGWRTTSQAWEFSKANWVQWEMQYIFFLPCCLRLIFGVANFLVTTKVITIITPTPAREFLKENGVQCKKPSLRLHHLSWLKSGSSTISSKRSTKAFNLVVDFAQHSGSIWK